MEYDIRFNNVIARFRATCENVTPHLIYTNTERVNGGYVFMDFVDTRYSDDSLVRAGMRFDIKNLEANPISISLRTHANTELGRKKAQDYIDAMKEALTAEYKEQYAVTTVETPKTTSGWNVESRLIPILD